MTLEFHPYAGLFPLMDDEERVELREDTRQKGLREPIDVFEGKILDGRNRYLCLADLVKVGAPRGKGWGKCEGTSLSEDDLVPGRNPLFKEYFEIEHGDALDYVISKNLPRRHLTDGQRASIAAKLATMRSGERTDLRPIGRRSQANVADSLNVSTRQVGRAKVVHEHGVEELRDALDRGEIGPVPAEQIARKPEEEQREELHRRGITQSPHMPARIEPDDSLDYFPTPPWAVRALTEKVFPALDIWPDDLGTVWEPACGEGHVSGVLEEYFRKTIATDVFDYSRDGRSPPGWVSTEDFLADVVALEASRPGADWIITNPPFTDGKVIRFIEASLSRARVGVAMFLQTRYLEGIGLYEAIYAKTPPTVIAQFVERVPLHKGRYDPDGSTMTAYLWLVWLKGRMPKTSDPARHLSSFFWIPPGCRETLARPTDRERFTAHPVKPLGRTDSGETFNPVTGEMEGRKRRAERRTMVRADGRHAPGTDPIDRTEGTGIHGSDRRLRLQPGTEPGEDEDRRSRVGGGEAFQPGAEIAAGSADATASSENLSAAAPGDGGAATDFNGDRDLPAFLRRTSPERNGA